MPWLHHASIDWLVGRTLNSHHKPMARPVWPERVHPNVADTSSAETRTLSPQVTHDNPAPLCLSCVQICLCLYNETSAEFLQQTEYTSALFLHSEHSMA